MIRSTVPEEVLYDYADRRRVRPSRYEAMLWKRLKHGYKGVNFEREIVIDGFAVDFYCHAARVAIELDGPEHNAQKDAQRDKQLFHSGVTVLRFKNPRTYSQVTALLFRAWAECRYQIRRRKLFFPTDAQRLQTQQDPSLSLKDKDLQIGGFVSVQNVENSIRVAAAIKAAGGDGQLCAFCGSPRWTHYNLLRHTFRRAKRREAQP